MGGSHHAGVTCGLEIRTEDMAVRKKSRDILCVTCDKRFKYLSKYKRHLLATSHQRFEESLRISVQDIPMDDGSTGSATVFGSSPHPHPDVYFLDQRADREVNTFPLGTDK